MPASLLPPIGSAEAAHLADEALRLVGVDKALAEERAQAAVKASQLAGNASAEATAWRARGLIARDSGDLAAAESHLLVALVAAARAGPEPTAEAQMTLAFVRLERGNVKSARSLARRAVSGLVGQQRARAQVQLALIEQRGGAFNDAMTTYGVALKQLHRYDDGLWEARLRNNRGILRAYRGETSGAIRDLSIAEQILTELGQEVLAADARWNLGFAAGLRGDAVTALECFEDAGGRLAAAGISRVSHALDQCQVLLSVGLIQEARLTITDGIAELDSRGVGTDLAEAQLLLSETLLATGDLDGAARAAREAVEAFRQQGRTGLSLLANYALLRASVAAVDDSRWQRAEQIAAELMAAGWTVPATDVRLLIVQREVAAGRPVSSDLQRRAELAARSGPAGQRLRAWHTVALARLMQGRRAGAVRALSAGLAVHDRDRAALAATELQVHVAARAAGLASTGLAIALEAGRAATVFAWAERWRSGSLLIRPVAPSRDGELAALLTSLRAVTAELEQVRLTGDPRSVHRRQQQVEQAVARRARALRVATQRRKSSTLLDVQRALGGRALIEYVVAGRDLAAVLVTAERCTLHRLGDIQPVREELEALRFAAARLARGSSPVMRTATRASLVAAATRLDDLLLDGVLERSALGPVVIIPTGEMHVLPWGLLPRVSERPLCVAPSSSAWLAASERLIPPAGRSVFIAGPDLPGADAEVAALSSTWQGVATVLDGTNATVAGAMEAMPGARLVHIAAHGRFRSDNPLLSSLAMTDGPLTVYDLESLGAVPPLVVLSACDAGLSSLHPGEELMGLTSAFLRLGSGALVASVAPVPDEVAKIAMTAFHAGLADGPTPAEALLQARLSLDEDERLQAGAFVCFGAG